MSKVLITQSNYIPWKGYFDSINMADIFIIYDDMQYTKRDWRNRNKIKTSDGTKWLTVPVNVKGKFHQKINEAMISEPDWTTDHWNMIKHNYNQAPFFNELGREVESWYRNCKSESLSKINEFFIVRINEFLGIKTAIMRSEAFNLVEGKTEKLVNLCKEVHATEYFTGPAAKNYLNESLFSEQGIHVNYLDYSNYPVYAQLHGPFIHEVTILDLIFNQGHQAGSYMKSIKNE